MTVPNKFESNMKAILPDFEKAVREMSTDDSFGMVKVEIIMRNGCAESVRTTPSRDRRVNVRPA